VAPQKDICPQGNTYPKKATSMDNRKISTPILHVIFILTLLKNNPRPMCVYMSTKNKEAPLACKRRTNQPKGASRIMWDKQSKAKKMLGL